MNWNVVFNYFIEIKKTIGSNFTYEIPFKDLVDLYGTAEQWNRIKDLQFTQYNSLLLIRYGDYDKIYNGEQEVNVSYWDLHDGFYRECRSLVIDLDNEEIVLSPYAKFLNMNETESDSEENVIKRINNANVVEFSNKLDGLMVSARYYNGEYVLSTSKSLDENNSWRLKQAYDFLNDNIKEMISAFSDHTFIFELISKEDSHVVNYNDDDYGLHLIGIRSVVDGYTLDYEHVENIALFHEVKYTKTENITFNEMLSRIKTDVADKKRRLGYQH